MESLNPATVAPPLGLYSQAVLVSAPGRWLTVAGQVGVRADGTLADGFAAQAEVALANIGAILAAAGMDATNLVKVTTFVTEAGDLPALGPIRAAFLGAARPASTLLVVKALARPEWLIEIEATAFKP